MAFQISIPNRRTGHVNSYWRLTAIAIDALTRHVQIVLSGYADEAARSAGHLPDDSREWTLGPAAFAAIASQAPQGASVYDANAIACYEFIRQQRRPVPRGMAQLQENGDLLLPTGELVEARNVVDEGPDYVSVPSEFAFADEV